MNNDEKVEYIGKWFYKTWWAKVIVCILAALIYVPGMKTSVLAEAHVYFLIIAAIVIAFLHFFNPNESAEETE